MTVMSEVPKQDVIKRIDKALRPRQLELKPAPADQPRVEDDRNRCYRWNLVDARSNSIILPNLRLDSFAEAIGALRYWEYVPDVPTPGPGF
jgi:hypothetical protein